MQKEVVRVKEKEEEKSRHLVVRIIAAMVLILMVVRVQLWNRDEL